MKKLLTTACLFVVTIVAIVYFIAPTVFGQGKKRAKVKLSPAKSVQPGMRRPNPRDGLQYVWIPAGTFQMGCVPGDDECSERSKPRHSVRITKGFWMGQTEVTVAAYKRFLDATIERVPEPPDFNAGWQKEDHPIVNVTFRQAARYCEWAGGRLPTEAEWEYAGRGGMDGLKYPWGNTLTHEDANYGKDKPWGGLAQGPDLWEYTAPVGSFRPNGYGLYDVTGNVSEWVTDWLGERYYSHSPLTDPQGPPTGTWRVVRGGAWFGYPGSLRLSARIDVGQNYIGPGVGFRCILTTDGNASPPNDDVRTALMRRAHQGHTEAVSALLAGGADVNTALKNGQTALMGAAFGSHAETVRTLLAKGANVNATANDSRTALMFAAGEGQTETARILLAAGAKVNAADKYGETALMGAAQHGHTQTVKALLAAGANVNATATNGWTALMQAAIGGHTETLKELLAAGANVNARARGGATALRMAKYKKHSDIIVLLQKAGAEE